MSNWLADHDYQSVRQLQGCMCQKNCSDPAAFERAQYLKTLMSYKIIVSGCRFQVKFKFRIRYSQFYDLQT